MAILIVDNNPDLRFGLVGAGSIAEPHVCVMTALPEAQLVAVHSRTVKTGEKFARDNGCAFEPTLERLHRDRILMPSRSQPQAARTPVSASRQHVPESTSYVRSRWM
jgi:hypothetical protein